VISGIARQGDVAMLNIQRPVYWFEDAAWDAITSHLTFVLCPPVVPQRIRLQTARTLDDISITVPRNLPAALSDLQAAI
jgi:hypothetical protein